MDPSTIAVTAGRGDGGPGDPVNPPVELSSTFHFGAAFGYGRARNATWDAFEEALGLLEGGTAFGFGSGMAAIAAAVSLVPPGGAVVVDSGGYHGTRHLLHELAGRGQLVVREVDTVDPAVLSAACVDAAMVWIETPTNPLMGIVDLAESCDVGHRAGAVVVVDNTFATPLLQRPLAMGADVAVHSVSKFLSGHSDVVMGAVVASDEAVVDAVRDYRTYHGAIPGPFETFLALRGMRTLPVRLARAEATASALVDRLLDHPAVSTVRWPGHADHPQHALAARQMDGFGSMLSFDVADAVTAEAVCGAVELIIDATSLGGVETLIERRGRYEPPGSRVPPGLLRLSVGLEHPDDLWADLAQALASVSP
ncbi:MAG: trans-sulfuration enzyme family protein [Acidimicrobiales bacterium]